MIITHLNQENVVDDNEIQDTKYYTKERTNNTNRFKSFYCLLKINQFSCSILSSRWVHAGTSVGRQHNGKHSRKSHGQHAAPPL